MTLVAIAASAVTIAMLISQLTVIKQLKQAHKVPILQFLMSFLSSILWLKYGLIKHDNTVIFVNGIGSIISFYILASFWWYSTTRSHVEIEVLATAVTGVLLVSYVDHSRDPMAVEAFSMVCCLMSLVFLASPLSQIGNVVKLKDASVLLPSVALLAFANNILWLVYGYIHQDPFMIFPNIIGALFCALQLVLIAIYGRAAAGRLPVALEDDGVLASSENVQMTEISHGL
ncbi:Sugar transporter [Coemansia spiralis]|uniref:Sugar transporter SWEET1 n=2 Tax=Coemansia TaxID=4863 RepID=A0A9W8G345_9FUNG|nr:sugar efflux transporter for intercellular exchange-domain-containing protein [Coemansia spiralis]KAJ1992041.1 Sugar transporter [Coemansia umbellata]KAJ2621455.1 Sugar transporter [Coemansia sp. RSA 1358]KAJ2669132.1 Sugar transporter [Coemansia spiralis]